MALLHLLINLFLIVGFFLFLFFFPHEQWEDEAALLPAARRWSLPARRMSPSAQLSTAVHHPARAEVGLGVTLSTAPAALGQTVIMSIPYLQVQSNRLLQAGMTLEQFVTDGV